MRRALVGVSLMSDSMDCARAFGGAGFDDFAGEHEKRDDAGGLVIAGSERRQHGDGDEFVDAQAADGANP